MSEKATTAPGVSVKVDAERYDALRKLAAKNKRWISGELELAIDAWLKAQK